MKITGSNRHAFVCAETDRRRLLWFDRDGNLLRERIPEGVCFDVWALPGDRTLYTHYGLGTDGVSIVDRNDRLCFRYEASTSGEIFGCQPLANGHILLGEVQSKCITEVDEAGRIIVQIPVEYTGSSSHECMRMIRHYNGYYFVVQPGSQSITVYNADGLLLRRYSTHPDTFGIILRPNGNLLYTHRKGVVELDSTGRLVWELTPEDVPEVNIRWLLGIQLLSNGNLVLTNWLGHGHHGEGIPFFEVTPDKDIVWTCDCTDIAAEPAVLQVLDEDPATVCFTPQK